MNEMAREYIGSLMPFGAAFILLKQGFIISRFQLNFPSYWQIVAGQIWVVRKFDGISNNPESPFQADDMLADDWIVYKPGQML